MIMRGAGLGGGREDQGFSFGQVRYEMPVSYPSRDVD